MYLPDGTCVPSYMSMRVSGQLSPLSNHNNFSLREGEIKSIVYPQDPTSRSKLYIEYIVDVNHSEGGSGVFSTSKYVGTRISNLFGGVADFFKYTLRPATSDDPGPGVGSKVLLLCINGLTNSAIILGGSRDYRNELNAVDQTSDGHNLSFSFNGITVKINKHGELKIAFAGKTKVDGSIDTDNGATEEAAPTTLEILRDGSLDIYTKDRNQFIKFDHANHKVTFQADTEHNTQINGRSVFNADGVADWTFGDAFNLTTTGDTTIDSGGAMNLTSSGGCSIQSSGVTIGSGSEKMALFSTYRQAQALLHNQMQMYFTLINVSLVAAATCLKVPMTGGVAASVPLQLVAQTFTQLGTAISTFEQQSQMFLSQLNSND